MKTIPCWHLLNARGEWLCERGGTREWTSDTEKPPRLFTNLGDARRALNGLRRTYPELVPENVELVETAVSIGRPWNW